MAIELDELLDGLPSWEEVVEFFKDGEFCAEQYLVRAIKKHLLTEEQRKTMFDHNMSIEEMLNGRVEGDSAQEAQQKIYDEWNKKLGFKDFGY